MTFNDTLNRLRNLLLLREITPEQCGKSIEKEVKHYHNIIFDINSNSNTIKEAERAKDKYIIVDSYLDEILYYKSFKCDNEKIIEIIQMFDDILLDFE